MPPLKGRAAIEQYYRELFAGPIRIADFTFTHLESATARGIGYATGIYKQKLLPKSGEPIEDSGNFVVVVRRDAGVWKAAWVIYNSHHPPAGADAAAPAAFSPFPVFTNYGAAIASMWLLRFGWISIGCICLWLLGRVGRTQFANFPIDSGLRTGYNHQANKKRITLWRR